MNQRPNAADLSSNPPIRIGDGQWLSKKQVFKVGNEPIVSLVKEPSSLKSVFADSQRHFKQWEQTEDGPRQLKGRQLVSEIIESKRILTLECSKEILRLTHLVRDLQQEQQSIRKAYELKYPSCYPSRPPSSRHFNPHIEEQSEPPPRKVIARGIRKVQRSMQFDGQDVAALFGGIYADKKIQVGADVAAESKEPKETDVYQLEIEISDKRENANQTEYQVRKKISFSRWQSLQNLKKENLYDLVNKFDRKPKEEGFSVGNNHLSQARNLNVKKPEKKVPEQYSPTTDSGSEVVVVTEKNKLLSNEQRDAKPEGIEQVVSPHLNDLGPNHQAEYSRKEEGQNPDWFYHHSEEDYFLSDLSSSDQKTMELHSSDGSNSLSERSQGSQTPLSKKSLGFKPTLTERASSSNQRTPSIKTIE